MKNYYSVGHDISRCGRGGIRQMIYFRSQPNGGGCSCLIGLIGLNKSNMFYSPKTLIPGAWDKKAEPIGPASVSFYQIWLKTPVRHPLLTSIGWTLRVRRPWDL